MTLPMHKLIVDVPALERSMRMSEEPSDPEGIRSFFLTPSPSSPSADASDGTEP